MKSYVQRLKLSFDPFRVSAISNEFFEGGNRSQVRDQIVERAMYSESLISVSGCLGSGKTSLLAAITRSFGEEAVVVDIVATLFMNPDQFMDQLVGALQLPGEFEGIQDRAHAVAHLAGQLQMDARSLLIQVDDAHELSSEVLKELVALKKGAVVESVHVILFGESQLGNLLENTLEHDQLAILAEFELDGFGSEATIDYVRFKLGSAGYTQQMPLAGSVLGSIHNSSNGMPGAINALVRDALDKEFAADAGAVGVELGALESQLSADVAIDENEFTEDELEEFSAAREVGGPDSTFDETSSAARYFVAAAILLVMFVAAIAMFRPNQGIETDVAQISVPVSGSLPVASSSQSAIPALAPEVVAEEAPLPAIAQRPRVPGLSQNVTEDEGEQAGAATGTIIRTAEVEPVSAVVLAAAEPEPVLKPVSVPAEPAAIASSSAPLAATGTAVRTPEPVTADSNANELSSFERNLLSYPSANYTVQIVGASSEANIQAFVAAAQLSVTAGYFGTLLNGKPWYVVVAGNFPDRESATALLSALPDSAKASGPWVRSLARIQSDIQKSQ
ncbi:MAG: septal ring-binding cell division protein DamX/type II secretory pathway predicted ATPase ExeA [Glaciecola sp.]|jgi:DamX protein